MSIVYRMGLVGREREQTVVAGAVERVAAGTGGALLISGESGIGKSALARHAVDLATRRGFTVLSARAQPLDRDLAYTTIIQAFGRHLRSLPGPRRDRVTEGIPALSRLFPDLGLSNPEPLDDPRLERTRLFEAVLRLLERTASDAPVALCTDDLHWADEASVDLLGYLVRDLPQLPVLLIATFRDDAAVRGSHLTALLDVLRRADAARDLPVSRLAPHEIRALGCDLFGGPVSIELADVVAGRSCGVPLFVEIFARWLRDTGRVASARGHWTLTAGADKIPPAIRDVLSAELDALTPAHRRLVDLIAVGGDAAGFDVLKAVARLHDPGSDVYEAMTGLIAGGKLIEDADGTALRYRFSHPLLHEVAYELLPTPARRHLHELFIDALEQPLDQASHCLAAGPDVEPEHACDILLAAGRQALDRYAHEDAKRYFSAALDRAEHGAPELRSEALIGLGDALQRSAELTKVAVATADGYEPVGPCVAVPGAGGMGQHYGNFALLDTTFEVERPEVVLYEPTADGTRLVAVEYVVVDADQDTSTDFDRPYFGDVAFEGPMEGHEEGEPVHYELHVWLWKHNPAGLFAPFNPRVSC